MSITIFVPRDNGDLKYIAEVDEVDRPEMALDALLDEMPRVANQGPSFVALMGTMEDGAMVTLVLDPDAPVEERPKRAISVSSNGVAPAAVEEPEEDEEPAPAPRRRAARKGTARRGTARKPAKKVDGRTKAARAAKAKSGGKSPFRSRPEED
jgi:hypothetical protein